MSRFTSWWPVAAVSLIATISSPVLGKEVDLRPKFEKGAEIRFEMVVDGESEQQPDEGPAAKQQVTQTIGVKLVGGDTDAEGNTTVSLVYESLKLVMKSDMMSLEFDSTQPPEQDENPMLGQSVRSLIGATLTLTVDKNGDISKASGNEPYASGLTAMLASFDGLKAGLGPIFTTHNASGKAEVGGTWSFTDTLPNTPLGPMTITTDHTLTDVSGNDAKVDIKGKLAVKDKPLNGMEFDEGSYGGTYVWDTAKGMLKSLSTKQTMEMSGLLPQGQHGKVIVKGNTSVTRK